MLYSEIIAVCSQIHTKHTNTLCGQNAELLSVKPGSAPVTHKATHVEDFSSSLQTRSFSGDGSVINLKTRTAAFRLSCRLILLA